MGSVIVCRECGTRNAEDAGFCTSCGTFLEWASEPDGSAADDAGTQGGTHGVTASAPSALPQPTPSETADSGQEQSPHPAAEGRAAPSDDDFDPVFEGPAADDGEAHPTVETRTTGAVAAGATAVRAASPSAARPATTGAPTPPAQKPAEARQRVDHRQRVAAPPPSAPGEPPCPSCGVGNPESRRFCRRCGTSLVADVPRPTHPEPVAATRRPPWWRRLIGTAEQRAARARFRRTLSLQHRILRAVAGAFLGLAVLTGVGLALAGTDVGDWARERWNAWRPDRYVPVEGVTAATVPEGAEDPLFAAGRAADDDPRDGWATVWGDEAAPAPEPGACAAEEAAGGQATLLVTLDEPTDVTRVGIGAGLPADDPERQSMWRPTAVRLHFSDGSCRVMALEDSPEVQHVDVDVEAAEWAQVEIVGAAPGSGDDPRVAVHTVRLFTHP